MENKYLYQPKKDRIQAWTLSQHPVDDLTSELYTWGFDWIKLTKTLNYVGPDTKQLKLVCAIDDDRLTDDTFTICFEETDWLILDVWQDNYDDKIFVVHDDTFRRIYKPYKKEEK
jgi:hypothetical protein